MKTVIATAFFAIASTTAFAAGHGEPSSFQKTCSNILFEYGADGGAEIHATCLRSDGSPNKTSIAMPAIANNNGMLEMAGDTASFQQSCGNIRLGVTLSFVTLYANCRRTDGMFIETSIGVPDIKNVDGNLSH